MYGKKHEREARETSAYLQIFVAITRWVSEAAHWPDSDALP
jgi:hypothetical protein